MKAKVVSASSGTANNVAHQAAGEADRTGADHGNFDGHREVLSGSREIFDF